MKNAIVFLSLVFTSLIISCSSDDGLDFEAQLANDILAIDNFLLENNIDATEHESGLRYIIEEEGTGGRASQSSNVHAKFVGKFLSGDTFDENSNGVTFPLEQLIEAWKIAIPLIKEGGKITIYAPSVYCFGAAGQGPIGPNANLIFEIDLIDTSVSFQDQIGFDTELIDNYLMDNEIEALEHESGIRYVVTEEGSGDSPSASDVVNVKYEGRFFSGTVFDSNDSGVSFPLDALIPAWKTMIPLMKEGGKMTIYAQSGYCYGTSGNNNILPNESLIFDIELINVE